MQLEPDSPVGRPSFELSKDQVATVVNLVCLGASDARRFVTAGLLEVPINILVKKAMLRIKKQLGLTNLEVGGEFELLNSDVNDTAVIGRIDITLRFLHQFGDEEAYVGIECKRMGAGESSLNQRYVTQGVNRFVTGKYAAGHHWGMMLGYVLRLPLLGPIDDINSRIVTTYGESARLTVSDGNAQSLAIHESALLQSNSDHVIRLLHIFVDMTVAASGSA
jgi:hypothetical protein